MVWITLYKFFKEDLPRLDEDHAPLECVQETGDLVYIPDMWGHSVLNLADSIGIAYEMFFKDKN